MLSKDAIQEIARLGQTGEAPLFDLKNGKHGMILPDGYQLHEVDSVDSPLTTNIQQEVGLYDETSFVAYMTEFKQARSKIFAAPGFLAGGKPYFIGAIDYHEQAAPGRNQHTVTYNPRYSDEWLLWTKVPPMSQSEFAEFIEENRQDVVTPSAAALLDLARNFKATRKIQYDKAIVEQSGSIKLTHNDETMAGNDIEVPEILTIGIPVYFNGPKYQVSFWVRYRVSQGVTFILKPDRCDVIEKDAFDEMGARIEKETELQVYLGQQGRSAMIARHRYHRDDDE